MPNLEITLLDGDGNVTETQVMTPRDRAAAAREDAKRQEAILRAPVDVRLSEYLRYPYDRPGEQLGNEQRIARYRAYLNMRWREKSEFRREIREIAERLRAAGDLTFIMPSGQELYEPTVRALIDFAGRAKASA